MVRSIATGVVALLVLGVLAAPASAEELNLSGTWEAVYHCEAGGCAGSNFPATDTLTQAKGSNVVSGSNGAETINGTLNGNSFAYESSTGSYHAHATLIIAPDGLSWKGHATDTNGTEGTYTATRVSGGGGQPPVPPGPADSRHPTATGLSCGYNPLTASDTCTATVRDSATSAPSTPTGAVTLTASGGISGNGVFPSGGTCQLSGAEATGLAICTVEYIPPTFGLTKLQADYAGDATHAPSSTGAPPASPKACPKSKSTIVTCADPTAPPGVCKAPGPIYPQCYQPTVIPTVCSTSVIGNSCQSAGSYTTACGSIGTGLPECSLKSNSVPAQFCGPIGSGLPGCTGANNPITVCSASGSGLPQCSFQTKITGALLDASAGTGKVEETLSCPKAPTAAAGSRLRPTAKASGGGSCPVSITLNTYAAAQTRALSPYLREFAAVYARLAEKYFSECGCTSAFAQSPTVLATHNEHVAYVRARTLIDSNLTESRLHAGPTTKGEVVNWFDTLTERTNGDGSYSGPLEIWDRSAHLTGNGSSFVGLFADNLTGQLSAAVDEGYKLFKGGRKAQQSGAAAVSSATSGGDSNDSRFARQLGLSPRSKKAKGALLTRHLRLRAGQSVNLHLRLPRAVVRRLLRAAGPGATMIPLRLVNSYETTGQPTIRFVDLPFRVEHRRSKPQKH